jgi:hypothetical protein
MSSRPLTWRTLSMAAQLSSGAVCTRRLQREQRQHHLGRGARFPHDHMKHRYRLAEPHQQHAADAVGDQRENHRDDGRHPRAEPGVGEDSG